MQALADFNRLRDPNRLKLGQKLLVMGKSRAAPAPSTTIAGIYTVKSGDTLWAISKKTNTSVESLKRINRLSSNQIKVGQTLRTKGQAPAQPKTQFVTVRRGDTFWKIAKRNGVTVADLKRWNTRVNPNRLKVGSRIRLER